MAIVWEELYCFGDVFCLSAWDVYAMALVVFRGGSEVPSIYTLGDQVRRLSGVSCTMTSVPGSASGVLFKCEAVSNVLVSERAYEHFTDSGRNFF